MHWHNPERGVMLCLDPRPAVTVVLAGAGLTPVFQRQGDGSLFATVPQPAMPPAPFSVDVTNRRIDAQRN